jgi:hypothetical protein
LVKASDGDGLRLTLTLDAPSPLSPRKDRIGTAPGSDLGIDPKAPMLPGLAGSLPSAELALALPGVAPALSIIGRLALADQGVATADAANLEDPFSEAHP